MLDWKLDIPVDCQLLNTTDTSEVLIITTAEAVNKNQKKQKLIGQKGGQIITVATETGRFDIDELLTLLGKKDIQQLLVEGGAETISEFITAGKVDEATVYIADFALGENGKTKITEPMAELLKKIETAGQKTQLAANTKISAKL